MSVVRLTDRAERRVSFDSPPGERILLAGLAAGHPLPHECATGTCGTCRARVVSGTVLSLWPEAPAARSLRDPAEMLMCQCVAEGPVELAVRGALPPDPPATTPRWVAGEVSLVSRLTDDVATFAVTLAAPLAFLAGQFVLVQLPGVAGLRAYSMTRRCDGRPHLDLLVRRGPGPGTARLFALEDRPAPVRVFGPLGRAVFLPGEGRPFVAIAGGSGIAGILSILDEARATGALQARPARLFFGLRTPDKAYLLDELAALSRAAPLLSVEIVFSDRAAPPDLAARLPDLRFAEGPVHERAASALAAQPRDPARLHYVAGPPAMVEAAMRTLVLGLKVPPTEIRYDRFG